jgi:hypothetical protein
MEHDEPLVLGSAKRHGVGEADALHAWAFAIPLHAGHLMPIFHDPDHVTIVRSRPTPGRGSTAGQQDVDLLGAHTDDNAVAMSR